MFYVDRMVCVHTECTEAGNMNVCLYCFTPRVYYVVFINLPHSCYYVRDIRGVLD